MFSLISQIITRSVTPMNLSKSIMCGSRVFYSSERSIPDDILRSTVYNMNHGTKTCIILHGLMGNRRNWNTFAKRICKEYPQWTVWAFDLRGHGDSVNIEGDCTIPLLSNDVLHAIDYYHLNPELLVGFSMGGKVALEMLKQLLSQKQTLPKSTFIVDSPPFPIRNINFSQPIYDLIKQVRNLPQPILGFHDLLIKTQASGIPPHVASWLSTSLKPIPNTPYYKLLYNLDQIEGLFEDYLLRDYSDVLANPNMKSPLTFLQAEHNIVWDTSMIHNLTTYERMSNHLISSIIIPQSTHWVHVENPDFVLNCFKDYLDI